MARKVFSEIDEIRRRLAVLESRATIEVGIPPSSHASSHEPGGSDELPALALALPAASTDNGIPRWVGVDGDELDDTSGPTLEDDGRIANLTDPTGDQDAATKAYADGVAATALNDYAMIFRPGVNAVTPTSQAGNFTVGLRFIPYSNMNVTGAEFYIIGTSIGKNIKVQLWSDAGSSLASVTVNSVVSGSNVATFGSPVAVTAGTAYRLSMYTTDGTVYMRDNTITNLVATVAALYTNMNYFLAGDNFPTSTAASERYPINPTFST